MDNDTFNVAPIAPSATLFLMAKHNYYLFDFKQVLGVIISNVFTINETSCISTCNLPFIRNKCIINIVSSKMYTLKVYFDDDIVLMFS